MKNSFYHIVALLFIDYRLPVLLLPMGMENEGRPIYPAEKVKQENPAVLPITMTVP